jgi:hypothetical protein
MAGGIIDFMNIDEIRNDIICFNNDSTYQKIREYYQKKTYLEILGWNRDETTHSNFISWILNPKEWHGLSDYGIRKLFEIIISSKFFKPYIFDEPILNSIITENYNINNTKISREYSIGKFGRVDIYVEFEIELESKNINKTMRLIIENKVKSNEHDEQTEKYYQYFSKLNDHMINTFIYLTPKSSIQLNDLSEPECVNKNFIQINYQDIVDKLLEPVLKYTR